MATTSRWATALGAFSCGGLIVAAACALLLAGVNQWEAHGVIFFISWFRSPRCMIAYIVIMRVIAYLGVRYIKH